MSQKIAHFGLDFLARQSVCVVLTRDRTAMDRSATDIAIHSFLVEMRSRLSEAGSIASTAEACAAAGNLQKAIEVALFVALAVDFVRFDGNPIALVRRELASGMALLRARRTGLAGA